MAYVKIEKVKNITASVDYVMQDYKTEDGSFITAQRCEPEYAAVQFIEVHNEKMKYDGRNFSVKAWMIYQSFAAGEISPHDAHKLGVELADRYLGDGFQKIITTHVDTGHIHNHIVFNAVNQDNLKCFDSKTKHIIRDLRGISDRLCEENNLSIIKNPKGKGCSQREYYARKHDRSFKAQIEKAIDESIAKSDNLEEFFEDIRKSCTIEKRGKNYVIKMHGQKKATRLSSLGIDYCVESICNRIDDKSLKVADINVLEQREITKAGSGEKYAVPVSNFEISGSVESLLHIAHETNKERIESRDYRKILQDAVDEVNALSMHIQSLDEEISSLEKYVECKKKYENSYPLMNEYRNADDKPAFKKKHWKEFKEYDYAKKYIAKFKENGRYPSVKTMEQKIGLCREDRKVLYEKYLEVKRKIPEAASRAGFTINRGDISGKEISQ